MAKNLSKTIYKLNVFKLIWRKQNLTSEAAMQGTGSAY